MLMCQSVYTVKGTFRPTCHEVSCTDASPTGGGSGTATALREHPLLAPPPVEYDGTCGTCGEDIDPSTLHLRYKCASKCGRVCCSVDCLSKHRKLCPKVDCPKCVFGERFSGPNYPLTKAMGLEGFFVQPPLYRPFERHGDFFSAEGKQKLEDLGDEGELKIEHWAPECKTFSAAWGKPVYTSAGNWIQGLPALRSQEKPWGIHHLSHFDQVKVRQGNSMAKLQRAMLGESLKPSNIHGIRGSGSLMTPRRFASCQASLRRGFPTVAWVGSIQSGRVWSTRLHELMNVPTCPGHTGL